MLFIVVNKNLNNKWRQLKGLKGVVYALIKKENKVKEGKDSKRGFVVNKRICLKALRL